MSDLPPPTPGSLQPPTPAPTGQSTVPPAGRLDRAADWVRLHVYQRNPIAFWAALAAVVGLVVIGSGALKKDTKATTNGAGVGPVDNVELLRVAWNNLPAATQFEVCASVHRDGLDVAADDVQRAAGKFGSATHDDVTFFLDLACN